MLEHRSIKYLIKQFKYHSKISTGCSLQRCSPSASSSAAPRKRMSLYPFLYILHPYVIQICNQHILHSPDRCIANELSQSYNLCISAFELLSAVIEPLSMCNSYITLVTIPLAHWLCIFPVTFLLIHFTLCYPIPYIPILRDMMVD